MGWNKASHLQNTLERLITFIFGQMFNALLRSGEYGNVSGDKNNYGPIYILKIQGQEGTLEMMDAFRSSATF